MPFHLELRQGMRRAWAFNLEQEAVWRTVLEPWGRGAPVRLGDREWDPRESMVRILEGPQLEAPDLALGRGWHNAERSARDVTADLLARVAARAASVAVIAETAAARSSLTEVLGQLGVPVVDWKAARAGILAGAAAVGGTPPELGVGAAIIAVERPEHDPSWLFDAGLALGALGGRAIVVAIAGEAALEQLRELAVTRLDPAHPGSVQALAERLRQATGSPGKAAG